MNYKVGILGASGRMGLELCSLLSSHYRVGADFLELSDAVSKSLKLRSIEGVDVRRLDDPPREPVHLWIDFSQPEATLALLKKIDTPIVIGTTGFTENQLQEIREYSKKRPVMLTSNTSPGMNLMIKMLETCPIPSSQSYSVVASETHHRHKKDSPSGSLKTLLKILESQGHRDVQVQVARAGEIKGTHQISFISDDEELTLTHKVYDRSVFARGAILAAHYLVHQEKAGMYRFQDVEVM